MSRTLEWLAVLLGALLGAAVAIRLAEFVAGWTSCR
jgi:hypothetical protein